MNTPSNWSIFIGFDPREGACFEVCRRSLKHYLTIPLPIRGVMLSDLVQRGLYTRPTLRDAGNHLFDVLSDHPMATEFAISRFLVPHLAGSGLALFVDCDVNLRANVVELFRLAQRHPEKALWCVKHNHDPLESTKMDGQLQSRYHRKNWSSVMLFNCDHRAHLALTLELVNSVPGRDLHRFCWLHDDDIGELGAEWNYLLDEQPEPKVEPKLVHFTRGPPYMIDYGNNKYAAEWLNEMALWAS